MKRTQLTGWIFGTIAFGLCLVAHGDSPEVGQPEAGLAVGVVGGHQVMNTGRDGDDINLVGHYALTEAVRAELEFGLTEYHAGDRRDRRIGLGLLTWLRPAHRWSPYLALGIGNSFVTLPGYELDGKLISGEAGGGVTVQVHDRLSIAADLRAGVRRLYGGTVTGTTILVVLPVDHTERYARGRIAVLVHF